MPVGRKIVSMNEKGMSSASRRTTLQPSTGGTNLICSRSLYIFNTETSATSRSRTETRATAIYTYAS